MNNSDMDKDIDIEIDVDMDMDTDMDTDMDIDMDTDMDTDMDMGIDMDMHLDTDTDTNMEKDIFNGHYKKTKKVEALRFLFKKSKGSADATFECKNKRPPDKLTFKILTIL